VGSDSGRITILQYDGEKNQFVKVHQETYGKTGCRRTVPCQYIAVDPLGRACMIASFEKQKFVYILNRENEKLTISSPLEAHKSHTVCYDIVGLDMGNENAQFACIEVDYGDTDNKDSPIVTGQIQKYLTVYQIDFGLNHAIKHSTEIVHESANLLIALPNKPSGPGGLFILCEDYLVYRNGACTKRVNYPRRTGPPQPQLIICYGFFKQLSRKDDAAKPEKFFYILQNELGDLFKLDIIFTESEVHQILLSYLDSIPPAVSLCIMKRGYLFAPAELGNHNLYKFLSLGDDETNPI